MKAIELGRILVARSAGVRRASAAVRVSAAQDQNVAAEIKPVRLSTEPITGAEVLRLVADLRHYCLATGIYWRDVEMAALALVAAETPPPIEARGGHHEGR